MLQAVIVLVTMERRKKCSEDFQWWLTFDGHEARNDIFISWCLKSRMDME